MDSYIKRLKICEELALLSDAVTKASHATGEN